MFPKARFLAWIWFAGLTLVACTWPGAAPAASPGTPSAAVSPFSSLSATGTSVVPTPTGLSPADSVPSPESGGLTSPNFHLGARVTRRLSAAQLAFLNRNFDAVITPFLGEDVRRSVTGPRLLLYRSIQGTWEGFTQFDWPYIDAHENMFLHHRGQRIKTVWDSWLMNPGDFVDESAPDALEHWINYYAVTAARQVQQYGYDGLFVDSASHWLNPHAVNGVIPDDYDLNRWHDDRVRALTYIKAQLPDQVVIFNGLHNQHGAEDSLAYTDGGMWETFAFRPQQGTYLGEEAWQTALTLPLRHPDKFIALVVKEQPNLNADMQKRLFAVGSYLLVAGEKVLFSMTDAEHPQTNALVYYPEYTLNLGAPQGAFTRTEQGLYIRVFEKGLVLVNPSAAQARTCTLSGSYFEVVPVGGGEVAGNGTWQGSLTYKAAPTQVTLAPVSALLLVTQKP